MTAFLSVRILLLMSMRGAARVANDNWGKKVASESEYLFSSPPSTPFFKRPFI